MKPSEQFKAALDQLSQQAALVGEGDAVEESFVYSGGRHDEHQEEVPGLYLSEVAAIDSWRRFAQGYLFSHGAKTFRFVQAPKLERFQITMADDLNTHRIASHRFGVRSKIAIVTKREAADGASKKPRKRKAARKKTAKRRKLRKSARK